MWRATRWILTLATATVVAATLTGQSGGETRQPAAALVGKMTPTTTGRVKPSKPFRVMTLKELEVFQERALRVYVSRWRMWQTHRTRYLQDLTEMGDRLQICRGARAPRWACWNLEASVWTRRELGETRGHIEARRLLLAHGEIISRLNRGLAGTPMAGLGAAYEASGRRHGVSPYLLAAVAGTESSFGAAACGSFNAWGLGNCEGSSWVPVFGSWPDAIDWYAAYLRRVWPSARTTYDFTHPNYAACPACWGRKTAWWMSTRFGAPNTVGYPA